MSSVAKVGWGERAARMYADGMGLNAIGHVFGYSPEHVKIVLQALGVEIRTRGRPANGDAGWEEKAVALYRNGSTLCGVVNHVGVSLPTVRKVLVAAGLTIRPKGRPVNPDAPIPHSATVSEMHAIGKRDVEIARFIGVSRERVRQIRKALGLPRQQAPAETRTCECGRTHVRLVSSQRRYCSRACGIAARARAIRRARQSAGPRRATRVERDVVADYQRGFTGPQIAARRGLTPYTVTAMLRRCGVERGERGAWVLRQDEIATRRKREAAAREHRAKGLSYVQIAKVMKCSPVTVRNYLHRVVL